MNIRSLVVWKYLSGIFVASLLAAVAQAQTACVFDFMGSQGETYAMARDFTLEAKRAGKSIIYSTHFMEEAEFLCDRIGDQRKRRL